MTEKEFRKLRPLDLIQLLLAQGNEVSQMQAELDKKNEKLALLKEGNDILKAKLNDRDALVELLKVRLDESDADIRELERKAEELYSDKWIDLDKMGSLTEAAQELYKIFEVAQQEAEQCLQETEQRQGELPQGLEYMTAIETVYVDEPQQDETHSVNSPPINIEETASEMEPDTLEISPEEKKAEEREKTDAEIEGRERTEAEAECENRREQETESLEELTTEPFMEKSVPVSEHAVLEEASPVLEHVVLEESAQSPEYEAVKELGKNEKLEELEESEESEESKQFPPAKHAFSEETESKSSPPAQHASSEEPETGGNITEEEKLQVHKEAPLSRQQEVRKEASREASQKERPKKFFGRFLFGRHR